MYWYICYGRWYTVLQKLVFFLLLSPLSSTEMCAYKYLDLPQQTQDSLIFHRNNRTCMVTIECPVQSGLVDRLFLNGRVR